MFVNYSMYKLLPILLFAYGLAVTTEDIYDNSWALIIGIDKYENVQNLNYAVKDAESIQDILVNTFDFPEANVRLLINEDATKQSIIEAFSDITTKAEDRDRVLIYFAGHGETMDLPDGGEMGYLLPVDGNDKNLYVSSIGMAELKNISLMSKAKHLLYLVDACYGGIATIGSRGLDSKTTPNYIEKITKNKSRQIITAGGRGEKVIEKSEWGHSAFTLNLNRGLKDGNADLNADGFITAAELGIYLNEKVTIDSENQQTPQYGRMTSQEGEFVFVYSENTAVIQDQSANEKLDYIILEMEELKSQSKSDESNNADLPFNRDLPQSDYPLIFSLVYYETQQTLIVQKHIDKRSVIGLNFTRHSDEGKDLWDDDKSPDGEYWVYSAIIIAPTFTYFLSSEATTLFNPAGLLSIGLNFGEVENQTHQLKENFVAMDYFIAVVNRIKYNKVGLTFGFGLQSGFRPAWRENGSFFFSEEKLIPFPFITIDITNPFSKK